MTSTPLMSSMIFLLVNTGRKSLPRVHRKTTNKGLLLHYQSHVDNKYKHSLLKTMLIRAHRLSSSPDLFADECNNLRSMFLKLKYPPRLIESTINRFVRSQDQPEPQHQFPQDQPIRIVLPFKDQRSADAVRKDLSELSKKIGSDLQDQFQTSPRVLKKCRTKFDCLIYEMLFIRNIKPKLNTQSDSVRAKLFT